MSDKALSALEKLVPAPSTKIYQFYQAHYELIRDEIVRLQSDLTAAKAESEALRGDGVSAGVVPEAYMFADECGRTKIVLGKETAEHWCPPDETVTPLYAHPQPAQEDPDLQLIRERDYWEGKATELAEDVGKLLGVEVGEHSSANCPVQNAIDAVFRAAECPAQQGGVPEWWKLVPVEPTAAMISAFEHAPCAENYTDAATWAWEAMLDAAPQPPQEGEGNE